MADLRELSAEDSETAANSSDSEVQFCGSGGLPAQGFGSAKPVHGGSRSNVMSAAAATPYDQFNGGGSGSGGSDANMDYDMLRCGGIRGFGSAKPVQFHSHHIRCRETMGYILEEHFVTLSQGWR